jgi:hypothetical protein
MLVADRFRGAVEGDVAQTAHTRHQLDAKQAAEAEHGFALALGVSMQSVGLDLRLVLQQPIGDMDGFPHASGDEAGEQRDVIVGDVIVGDVVVGDAAIGAIADVLGTDETVLPQLDVGAVGNGGTPASPMPGQVEAGLLVDDVDHGRLQLVGVDVLRVDPAQRLRRRNIGSMSGGLAGAEIAAVAEHGEQVTLHSRRELRVGAGGRPGLAGVLGPVLSMFQNAEQVTFRHAGADFLFELRQPGGLHRRPELLQLRRAIRVQAEVTP